MCVGARACAGGRRTRSVRGSAANQKILCDLFPRTGASTASRLQPLFHSLAGPAQQTVCGGAVLRFVPPKQAPPQLLGPVHEQPAGPAHRICARLRSRSVCSRQQAPPPPLFYGLSGPFTGWWAGPAHQARMRQRTSSILRFEMSACAASRARIGTGGGAGAPDLYAAAQPAQPLDDVHGLPRRGVPPQPLHTHTHTHTHIHAHTHAHPAAASAGAPPGPGRPSTEDGVPRWGGRRWGGCRPRRRKR